MTSNSKAAEISLSLPAVASETAPQTRFHRAIHPRFKRYVRRNSRPKKLKVTTFHAYSPGSRFTSRGARGLRGHRGLRFRRGALAFFALIAGAALILFFFAHFRTAFRSASSTFIAFIAAETPMKVTQPQGVGHPSHQRISTSRVELP